MTPGTLHAYASEQSTPLGTSSSVTGAASGAGPHSPLPAAPLRVRISERDLGRLLAGVSRTLLSVSRAGQRLPAVAVFSGSPLCRRADSAMAAELFAQPEACRQWPGLTGKLLDFVLSIGGQGLALGETGEGAEILSSDPCAFDIRTAFHSFNGDLSRGKVIQTARGRRDHCLIHTGNLFEFRSRQKMISLDAESTITEYGLRREGARIVLWHSSRLHAETGFLFRCVQPIGTLEIRYEIDPSSPALVVMACFRAERTLRRARVTTALDQLNEGGFGCSELRILQGVDWETPAASGAVRAATASRGVRLNGVAIEPSLRPHAGPSLYVRPVGSLRLMSVTAEARSEQMLRWVLMRYGPATVRAGRRLLAQEERLLLSDVDEQALSAAFASKTRATPVGVLERRITTVAVCHALAWTALSPGGSAAGADVHQRALEWAEHELIHFGRGQACSADLATAVLCIDALRRAAPDRPLPEVAPLLDRLLRTFEEAGAFTGDVATSVADHAIILLALSRAAPADANAARALEHLLPPLAQWLENHTPAGTALSQREHALGIALLARASASVGLVAMRGVKLDKRCVRAADRLYRFTINVLRRSLRCGDDAIEADCNSRADTALLIAIVLAMLVPERHLADTA